MAAATVRAAADLDLKVGRRGHEVGPRPEVVAQGPPQPPRLGDRDAAGLRSGTAGDVGDGPRIGQPEAARGQPAIEVGNVLGSHPAQKEILLGCHPCGAVSIGKREVRQDGLGLKPEDLWRMAKQRIACTGELFVPVENADFWTAKLVQSAA